jgi:hypothetical protein
MTGGIDAYGKMPAPGDCFRINPAGGFGEAWDHWL